MTTLAMPVEVRNVLRDYYTCEVTTVNRQGQPVTWPALPYYDEEHGEILVTASIAFPIKALNARRYPRISLLYSDSTGLKVVDAPAVLVQGDATVTELLNYTSPEIKAMFRTMIKRQPDAQRFYTNRNVRKLFSWYLFQRLVIHVRPRRLLVWPHGDFAVAPTEIEVRDVE